MDGPGNDAAAPSAQENPTAPLMKDSESFVSYNDLSDGGVGFSVNFDEDMEPWLHIKEGLYPFHAHCNIRQKLFCLGELQWGYSIYHTKNSPCLTFKKRDMAKTRPRLIQKWFLMLAVLQSMQLLESKIIRKFWTNMVYPSHILY